MDCCIALVLRITAPDVRADFVATGLITQADTERHHKRLIFRRIASAVWAEAARRDAFASYHPASDLPEGLSTSNFHTIAAIQTSGDIGILAGCRW
jgi:hypothetical protein